jgi:L-ascorbate metabolism protein UlaG (beta-lactamase superfamily)
MKLTWFGHSAFRIEFGDCRVMIDPFLTGNPSFKGDAKKVAEGATHVLLSHGHADHIGDSVDILKANGAMAVGSAEVCDWLGDRGVEKVNPGNHSGTVDCGGFSVSFVNALHSSSMDRDPDAFVYLGNPLGLVVKAPGEPTLYYAGDTGIFSDMALINEIYAPEIGIVPIGDRFTMGGKIAALACRRYFNFRKVIPCHYATFGLLDQTPDTFIREMGPDGGKVLVPEKGKAVEL